MGRGGKGTRWWGEKQINMQLEKEEQRGEKKKKMAEAKCVGKVTFYWKIAAFH